MDIKNFLDKVCGEIKYRPVRKGISEELKSHIQEIKEEYTNKGIPENEAEEKAVSQMGVPEEIGRKLNKIHKPKLDWILLLMMAILMGFGVFVVILKQQNMNDDYIESTIIFFDEIQVSERAITSLKYNSFSLYLFLNNSNLALSSVAKKIY